MQTATETKPVNPKSQQITSQGTIYLGADPEFFFLKKGKTIGAERIIPQEGVTFNGGKIIIDGVQAEMNPAAETCRQSFARTIARHFSQVEELIDNSTLKDLSISIDPLVDISKAELGALSDKAKFFGCTPSKNIYDESNIMPIEDSSKYYKRSAGGHIHIGFVGEEKIADAHKKAKSIVRMLDIIVGNTAVLVDRHEGNIERRDNYGRAGEYRLPKHGIEYRTPSNFWLENYQLTSFVLGMTKLAIRIMASSKSEVSYYEGDNRVTVTLPDFTKEIFDAVDQDNIRKAINENDFDLALANFNAIAPILERIVPNNQQYMGLDAKSIPAFLYFVFKGKESFFGKPTSESILAHWKEQGESLGHGWESFLYNVVTPQMEAETEVVENV